MTDSNGEKQLIQIMPDGQAQYLKVDTEDDGTEQLIHISTEEGAPVDDGTEDGGEAVAMDDGGDGVAMETTMAPVEEQEEQVMEQEQEMEQESEVAPVEFIEDVQQVSIITGLWSIHCNQFLAIRFHPIPF